MGLTHAAHRFRGAYRAQAALLAVLSSLSGVASSRIRKAAERMGLTLETWFAAGFSSRPHACEQALGCDFAMLGGNVGIGSWTRNDAVKRIPSMPRRLTVTSNSWMMPVAMIGMTKTPEGQGEWAGKAALRILAGTAPDEISLVENRKWDLCLNIKLIDIAGLQLTAQRVEKGKVFP